MKKEIGSIIVCGVYLKTSGDSISYIGGSVIGDSKLASLSLLLLHHYQDADLETASVDRQQSTRDDTIPRPFACWN